MSERLIRISVIVCFVGLLIMGCSRVPEQKQSEELTEKQGNIQQSPTDIRSSLGKIHLGDSMGPVEAALGKDYKETYVEEAGHFSEPWFKREYPKGVTVIVGKNSGKVLEIETINPEFQTNLGAKVGDSAKNVFQQYEAKYKTYQSPQGEGELQGFYELEDKQLIIFDLNKSDNTWLNKEVKPDSKVERIKLTYISQVD